MQRVVPTQRQVEMVHGAVDQMQSAREHDKTLLGNRHQHKHLCCYSFIFITNIVYSKAKLPLSDVHELTATTT